MGSKEKRISEAATFFDARRLLRERASAVVEKKMVSLPEQLHTIPLDSTLKMLHELHVHKVELEMQNEELLRTQNELYFSRLRYVDLYDLAPVAYCTLTDTGLILECNLTFASLLDLARDELITQQISSFIVEEDRDIFHLYKKQLLASDQTPSCEFRMTKSDGTRFWVHLVATLVPNTTGMPELRAMLNDASARKQDEERIQHLAHFDALTGLPNRSQLDVRAEYAISLAQRNQLPVALMFLDLDHFKDINDSLGHTIGDALLIELANRLRSMLRDQDTVSRLGGDEFIFLLSGLDANGAANVAQKLLNIIGKSFRIGQYDLNVTGSIGIAMYPGDGTDLEALCKSADTAMYRTKHEGRHGYRFFTAEMQVHSARHLQLINALRSALEHDQLQVHYQPQISVRDGRIIGAEALLRWSHQDLGQVSPSEFIPIAENSGLIHHIGEWVLRQAVRQAKRWSQNGLAPLVIAVNLSAIQFRHIDLPCSITRILEEENLAPEYLELELTEGVALHDPQGAIAIMNDLHERGVRMSIDDFGTGYSSLGHLKKFKVYKLKIDRSFVRDISSDPEDKAIVGTIISMAKSLGMRTIAEGVETAEQLAFLREQGCDEIQGFYYSEALPADQFEEFVQSMR